MCAGTSCWGPSPAGSPSLPAVALAGLVAPAWPVFLSPLLSPDFGLERPVQLVAPAPAPDADADPAVVVGLDDERAWPGLVALPRPPFPVVLLSASVVQVGQERDEGSKRPLARTEYAGNDDRCDRRIRSRASRCHRGGLPGSHRSARRIGPGPLGLSTNSLVRRLRSRGAIVRSRCSSGCIRRIGSSTLETRQTFGRTLSSAMRVTNPSAGWRLRCTKPATLAARG